MLLDEKVFVGAVVSITSIRDYPWIVMFVGSLISWSSPYTSHTSRSVSLLVLSSRSKLRSPIIQMSRVVLSSMFVMSSVNTWLITFGGLYARRDWGWLGQVFVRTVPLSAKRVARWRH